MTAVELFSDDDFWTAEFVKKNGFDDKSQFERATILAFPEPEEDTPVTFKWEPLPHQIAPEWMWDLWLMLGGRGTGKTDGGAVEFNKHMEGPPCDPRVPGGHKGVIIAPTLGDASLSCVEGVSGLKVHNPQVYSVTQKGGTFVVWPNGARAKLVGAHGPADVDRLRAGGNNCFFWAEELAAWPQLRKMWDQLMFGLRLGPNPRGIATTTPKARKLLKELIADETTAITKAKTEDNPHLSKKFKEKLTKRYKGTRLGKQELDGQLLEDVPGAVATVDELAICRRLPEDVPSLDKRITMIDPSQTNTETSDSTGIAIGGRKGDQVYLLDDKSLKASVSEWVDEAVTWSVFWECSEIWYESNGGSDTYKEVIKAGIARYNEKLRKQWEDEFEGVAKEDRPPCPKVSFKVEGLPARMSKRDRAVALEMAIQQDRFHLVGEFEALEDQLTTWVPGEEEDEETDDVSTGTKSKMDSPNNMDAAVHLYRKLMGIATGRGRTGGSALRNSQVA